MIRIITDFIARRAARAPRSTEASWGQEYTSDKDEKYDEHLWVSHIADRVKLERVGRLLPASGSIVEFGCGSGRLLRFAAQRGMTGIGLDFAEGALGVARRLARSDGVADLLEFMAVDVMDTRLPTGSADVVASTGLFEHFEDDDVRAIIAEMVRVLKPGGLFYSDILPAKFSLYRSLLWLRRHPIDVYERPMTKQEAEAFLTNAGLTQVRVAGGGVFPPIIPVIERSHAYRTLVGAVVRLTLPLWTVWDNTAVGDALGVYWFCSARKPG